MEKTVHILYSGLGGHGNVVFSILNGIENDDNVILIFYGIEDVRSEYKTQCSQLGIDYQFIKKNRGNHIAAHLALFSLLRNIKPSVTFVHSSDALIPASFFRPFSKRKLYFVEHHPNNIKSKKEYFLSYLAMISANKVIFLTKVYQTEIKQKLGIFYNEQKAIIIPNGIDLDFYAPASTHETREWINIGMAARFSSTKDQLTLTRAVNNLISHDYKIKLWLAGDGEEFQNIKNEMKNLDNSHNITLLGLLSEEEILKFYQSLDIYVHSTLGETMSTSIMQAQACGLPIIASDTDGVNNVIQHNITGLLFPPKEVNRLEKHILQLIENVPFRNKLAKASLTYARDNLSMKRMAHLYNSLYSR
jgi:glycosyltransferase involved in cell wall biosynthesis